MCHQHRASNTDRDTDHDESHRPAEHTAQDVGRLRPERRAHSDLVRALCDGVRHHAVDADRGQQQRDDRERGHHLAREALRRERRVVQVVEREDAAGRHRRRNARDRALDARRHRRRILLGANDERHRAPRMRLARPARSTSVQWRDRRSG